jgi:hypothetical protein
LLTDQSIREQLGLAKKLKEQKENEKKERKMKKLEEQIKNQSLKVDLLPDDLQNKTVAFLKLQLKARNKPQNGNKQALINRLLSLL